MADHREKPLYYHLRASENGTYYFLTIDPDAPSAPKPMSLSMTEAEVREFCRTRWGYTGGEVDRRLRDAQRELEERRRRGQQAALQR